LRPSGYEFNNWFWMDSVVAKYQLHTVSICLIVSTVSGSPVSIFLFAARHDSIPITVFRARTLSIAVRKIPEPSPATTGPVCAALPEFF
jgi:hypothetical protein